MKCSKVKINGSLDEKIDLQVQQSHSKTGANATFAQICVRAQMDFAIDLLPIAMLVNATFAMYLR